MRITWMDIKNLRQPNIFEACLPFVDARRQERIAQSKQWDDKGRLLAAGLLLREAFVFAHMEEELEQIQFSPKGKPYLEDGTFFFSLSHAGDYAVCVSDDKPVACDIESMTRKIPSILNRIFSAEEEQYYNELKGVKQTELFFKAWTRKESLSKQVGKGIQMNFDEILCCAEGKFLDEIQFEDEWHYFRECHIAENYALTICSSQFLNEASLFGMEIFPQDIR